jgi:hypothetical protein
MAGFRLNRLFQNDQLTTATVEGAAPAGSSSGPISRPSAGFTPRTGKKFPTTYSPSTVSASSPSPRTLKREGEEAIRSLKTWLLSLKCS